MYKSRIHFRNNEISIAIDSVSGEIIELINVKNGDNLIKSTQFFLPSLFLIKIGENNLSVPDLPTVLKSPILGAQIVSNESPEGINIKIFYKKLTDGKTEYDISVTVEILIPNESPRLLMNLKVENSSGQEIDECRFPVLNGIYLGQDFTDDILIYPFNAGVKIPNPTEYLQREPKHIYWRWQEYRYCYNVDGNCGVKGEYGMYSLACNYSGPCSLPFMDYYDGEGGLYVGSHSDNGLTVMRAETLGTGRPGMSFSIAKKVESSESFKMNNCVVELHEGDWHKGADIYRAIRKNEKKKVAPKWFEKSTALTAHYDFKYQNGGIVHHFSDLPLLSKYNNDSGADCILVSGWHIDGFDNGFPEYRIDPELGSVDELKNGIKYAQEHGNKVIFYINTRMANEKFEHILEQVKNSAIVKNDGNIDEELCGNKDLRFAVMCTRSEWWESTLTNAAAYVLGLGADGVYFDQLAMAPGRLCHSKNHLHSSNDEWTDGYRNILDKVGQMKTACGESPLIIIEGCSDLYGSRADGQLVSTFSYLFTGAFPELYRYTCPEQRLVDMVYPKYNLAMRPVHVASRAKEMINKAFVCDFYYWLYDLEDDNTFRRDPEHYEYLKNVMALKKQWQQRFSEYEFSDTVGIEEKPENTDCKIFTGKNGWLLTYISDNCEEKHIKLGFKAAALSDCASTEYSNGMTTVIIKNSKYGIVELR